MFRVVRVVCRPIGVGPTQNAVYGIPSCALWRRILHHPVSGMLPPKECIPKRFQDVLLAYYSDRILLSGPAAAARPRYDILEMLEPLWPQNANKTEGCPVKFKYVHFM